MLEINKQLDRVIWDKWFKGKKAELKSSEFGWNQDTMPWKAELKLDAVSDQPFIYRAEGKYISFKPTGLWWTTPQGTSVIKEGVSTSRGRLIKGKVHYVNALGSGISLEASVSQTTWRKNVVIDSLASLGTILSGTEYLEIGFEIETDFTIPEWTGKSEYQFNTAIELTELTRIESINTWDSHVITEPYLDEKTSEWIEEDPLLRCDGFIRIVEGKTYLVKRIPVEYLQQAVYPVATDIVITYGAEYTFNAASTLYVSCAALDTTHFVVGYMDDGGDAYGHAMIGVVTGDAIAYGAEYTFNAALNTSFVSCATLDATHFVVSYKSGGDAHGKARIGVVTGNVIAYGAEYTFNAANTSWVSCAALDATHFVVGYEDGGYSNYGRAMIGVVTGDAIAYGAEYTFNAATTTDVSCAALDTTHFVVGYMDDGGADYGIAMIGVVTGDAIAYGAEYTFNAATTTDVSCATLDATHFVVGYRGNTYGRTKIGVVTGDAIAYGAEYIFNAASTLYVSCAALDTTHFVVGYEDSNGYGNAMIGVVTGDAIAYDTEHTFNAAYTAQISCAALDTAHLVVGYQDVGGDTYGQAKIGSIPLEGWANIAKVYGVASAGIATVDGVAVAGIAKIDGVAV